MMRPTDVAAVLVVLALLAGLVLACVVLAVAAMAGLVLATLAARPNGPVVNVHASTINEAPTDGFLDGDGDPESGPVDMPRAVCQVCGTVVGYNGGGLDGVECMRCGCRALIPVRPPEDGGDENDATRP